MEIAPGQLENDFQTKVIDLPENQKLAAKEQILVAPTPVRKVPELFTTQGPECFIRH